jgi:hypothetical protein
MFHLSLVKNMREEFGMRQGNDKLINSCQADNADDASMMIVKGIWAELNLLH